MWISKDIKTTIETILDKYIACCQGLSLLSYMISVCSGYGEDVIASYWFLFFKINLYIFKSHGV